MRVGVGLAALVRKVPANLVDRLGVVVMIEAMAVVVNERVDDLLEEVDQEEATADRDLDPRNAVLVRVTAGLIRAIVVVIVMLVTVVLVIIVRMRFSCKVKRDRRC